MFIAERLQGCSGYQTTKYQTTKGSRAYRVQPERCTAEFGIEVVTDGCPAVAGCVALYHSGKWDFTSLVELLADLDTFSSPGGLSRSGTKYVI